MMRLATCIVVTLWAGFSTYTVAQDDPDWGHTAASVFFAVCFWAPAMSAIWQHGRKWDA